MKLSKRAYSALERTIKYWKSEHENMKKDKDYFAIHTMDTCPLCKLYWVNMCVRCPIALKTKTTDFIIQSSRYILFPAAP